MSHVPFPRHKSPPRPRRMLAIGGAAVITTLTLGGATGLLPGAALGQMNAAAEGSARGTTNDSSTNLSADASAGSSHHGGGGWLTVEPRTTGNAGSDDTGGTDSTTAMSVPAHSGSGKRVVFSMTDQRVWLVTAAGKAERTYLVSGGVHDNLQPGTYQVYSTSRHATSFTGDETMNYMVRFTHGATAAIGFHDIPRHADGSLAEQRSDLGTPQSAGCIRQWKPDAKALWHFAPVGTTVVVLA